MISWLWKTPGVMTVISLATLMMIYTAHRAGITSPHFWWSLLIVLAVLIGGLTFRYFRETAIAWATPEQPATVRLALKVKPRMRFVYG